MNRRWPRTQPWGTPVVTGEALGIELLDLGKVSTALVVYVVKIGNTCYDNNNNNTDSGLQRIID